MSKILQPVLKIYKDEVSYLDVAPYLNSISITQGDISGYLDSGVDGAKGQFNFVLNNSDSFNFNPLVTNGAWNKAKVLLKGNGTTNITYPFEYHVFENTINNFTYGEDRTVNYNNYTLATFTNYELMDLENYDLENDTLNITILDYRGNINRSGDDFVFDQVIDSDEWLEITFAYWDSSIVNDINYLDGNISSLAQSNAYIEYSEIYGDIAIGTHEITIDDSSEYTVPESFVKGTDNVYFSTNTNITLDTLYRTSTKQGSANNKIIINNPNLQNGDILGVQYSYISGTEKLYFKGKLGNNITSSIGNLSCTADDQSKPLRRFYVVDEIREYTSSVTLETFIVQTIQDIGITLESTETVNSKAVYNFSNEIRLIIENAPLITVLPETENTTQEKAWDIIQYYVAQSTYSLLVEYSPDLDDVALVLRFPPREETASVATYQDSDLLKSSPIAISDENVRDKIVVRYNDTDTGEVEEITVTDENSTLEITQTAYIDLGSTSDIDTAEEAQTLAEACLNDMSTVQGQCKIDLLYNDDRVRFYDTIQFYNKRVSSTVQNLYVESFSRSINFASKSLTISYTGSTIIPRGYNRKWGKIALYTKRYENIQATNVKGEGVTIGEGAASDGGNGIYINKNNTDDTKLDTVIEISTTTGDVTFQSEDGDINFRNANNDILLDALGTDSRILLNVAKANWDATNNTVFQFNETTDDTYVRFRKTEGVDMKAVLSLDNGTGTYTPNSYISLDDGANLYGLNELLVMNFGGFSNFEADLQMGISSESAANRQTKFEIRSKSIDLTEQANLRINVESSNTGLNTANISGNLDFFRINQGGLIGEVTIDNLVLDGSAILSEAGIWWDSTSKTVKVYDGTTTKTLAYV